MHLEGNRKLPLDAIEQLIRFAQEKLEPFEDGTLLLVCNTQCNLRGFSGLLRAPGFTAKGLI